MIAILLGLQIFQLAILVVHDWIPLGRFNDIAAARRSHSLPALALGTAVSSLLPGIGLVLAVVYLHSGWPGWLRIYLLVAYGFLFLGELEAWWIPYLLLPQPKKAAEYALMYGETFAFLPTRNGVRINALHVMLHAATIATLAILILALIRG
jgi:hypothetical protein